MGLDAQEMEDKAKVAIAAALLFTAATLGISRDSSAAPSNGTKFPEKGHVEAGYEYNVMFRRPLDRSYGSLSTRDHFYTVSLGMFDWLALDGKIGFGDVRRGGGIHLPKIEQRTGFAGGYGFRVRAFEKKDWGLRLILGAQHISVHPKDRSVDDEKFESFMDDWQVSGVVAKDIRFLTVYTGMKLSDCEIVYKINKHDKKRRYSEQHVGLISGLEIYLFKRSLRLNVEARFFDETAFSTSAGFAF